MQRTSVQTCSTAPQTALAMVQIHILEPEPANETVWGIFCNRKNFHSTTCPSFNLTHGVKAVYLLPVIIKEKQIKTKLTPTTWLRDNRMWIIRRLNSILNVPNTHSFLDVWWCNLITKLNNESGKLFDVDHVPGIVLAGINDLCTTRYLKRLFTYNRQQINKSLN